MQRRMVAMKNNDLIAKLTPAINASLIDTTGAIQNNAIKN